MAGKEGPVGSGISPGVQPARNGWNAGDGANIMTEERKKKEDSKTQFLLTSFTQAAGIRTYAFEGRIGTQRTDYKVAVDLALIPRYGIRIQDLPLLCRELLQQQEQSEEPSAVVFTEQRMRCHAEELAVRRVEADHRKKPPRHLASAQAASSWQLPLR